MNVYSTDKVVCIDCDDTLVLWPTGKEYPYNHDATKQLEGTKPFLDSIGNQIYYLTPHKQHINLLKRYKSEGFTILVWSAGGYRWAETVVKTLKLEEFVDIILSKPDRYIDDEHCKSWFGQRIYIKA